MMMTLVSVIMMTLSVGKVHGQNNSKITNSAGLIQPTNGGLMYGMHYLLHAVDKTAGINMLHPTLGIAALNGTISAPMGIGGGYSYVGLIYSSADSCVWEIEVTGAVNSLVDVNFEYWDDGSANKPAVTGAWIIFPTVLSVKWISFTGIISNGNTFLTWKVSENDVNSYVIEQSGDGVFFKSVSAVPSKGDGINTYTFRMIGMGIVYYRIKQIDRNGRSSYSSIVKLMNYDKFTFVYPNPTKNSIIVSGIADGDVVQLFTFDGKLLLITKTKAQSISLDIARYPQGSYLIQVGNQTQKIIKL